MTIHSSRSNQILHQLMQVIEDRKIHPQERSYTNSLFAAGIDKIGAKIIEEAQEVVQAARESGPDRRQHVVHEVADLLYHVFVLLGHQEIRLSEIENELGRRFGVSGLDEKESRRAK